MKQETRFICDLPWKHLSVHPHGVCSVCCVANHAHDQSAASRLNSDGRYEKMNIKEGIDSIMNSDSFREVRRQMIAGEVPPACKTCWDVEVAGGTSKRQKDSHYNVDYDKSTKSDGSITVDLRNVELRLGNFCNLKCRSCNAESSTSWIDDFMKLKDKIKLPSNYDGLIKMDHTDYSWTENMDFYNELISYTKNLDQLHISGGEPFLVPKHFKFLDKLIEEDLAKNIQIYYITNGNYDFEKLVPALEKLKHFWYVNISISVDDIEDRNSYIRKNSNWELTVENIKNFITKYSFPNFKYTITQTVNAFNFMYIEELTEFLVKKGMYKTNGTGPIWRLIPNHVHAPEYQNATVIPIESRRKKLDSIVGKVSEEVYNDLYGRYYNAPQNGQQDQFYKVTETVDKLRKESWKDIFPKLKEALQKSTI